MHPTDPVNRIMTAAVLTVDANDPAGEVLRLFAGYPIHHLLVLEQQKVVGMLSSADLMKLELFLPKGGKAPIEYLNQKLKAGALVRRPPLTIQPHQSVETAAGLMAKNGVHALAVTDAKDLLLGIVTTTDIMHAVMGGTRPGGEASAGPAAPPADASDVQLSPEQLDRARRAAAAAAGTDQDRDFVNQAVIYLHARVARLEHVRQAASRYLHAGQDQQLHTALAKALEAAGRGSS